ncbi:MAG: TonB family protein [Thermoanaerobaculia bacterium]
MKILRISILMSLALAAGTQAWAQSPSAAPAPTAQASPAPAPLSKQERIELCKKKRGVPLEPGESQPLHVEDSEGKATRPTIIYSVKPRFTGLTGTVVVEALIDEDGCVRQTRIVRSVLKSMDQSAAHAIEQWVFLPATLNGRPVRVFYTLAVNTRIE